nr:uncharacterized protein LOC109184453 [Ipomoea batatas]
MAAWLGVARWQQAEQYQWRSVMSSTRCGSPTSDIRPPCSGGVGRWRSWRKLPDRRLFLLLDRTATRGAAFSELRVSSDGGLRRHPSPPVVQGDGWERQHFPFPGGMRTPHPLRRRCATTTADDEEFGSCKICGASRWKEDIHNGEIKIKSNGKKVPLKTMQHFPLKPRIQRLFMSRNIASFMRWHHDSRVDDGVMRHLADSMAWKYFDEIHKRVFFRTSQLILIPYHLPPWMCMKDSNFILSMLIPSPKDPGDAIDIYLKPLIKELKELWEVGVDTFDASTHQDFKLHASLLWTINDFPAEIYPDTCSMRLANCSKQCYMGHRRYLPSKHKWRNDKSSFDGTKELRPPPKSLSGSDILAQVSDLEGITLTKDGRKKVKISHEKRGRALGAGIARNLSDDEWLQAHIYVLKNCDEV